HVETSSVDILESARGPVKTYRAGNWISVEPSESPREVVHPSGSTITAYPLDSLEAVTLPRYLPGVNNISVLMALVPPPLNELLLLQGKRLARGETDPAGAVVAFYEAALAGKEHLLSSPPGYPGGWWIWVAVSGRKNGRQARYLCWPTMALDWTSVPLAITALRILRGEVAKHGVLPSEACFELGSFLAEASEYVGEEQRGVPLLNERFVWLE
ncbi:MAG: hypothetical protein J7M39_05040, partial [Anaerolineae bacterium]|nr:hypothetical protein [Anaerolineae bacterium]